MKQIEDNSVDLLVCDPPYEIHAKSGGGLHNTRDWLKNIHNTNLDTFNPIPFLDAIRPKMKIFNAYIFCSKNLLKKYIEWIEKNNLNWDLLILSKTNPIPTKNNKYLPDTEICLFIRERGAFFNNELPFDYYFKVKRCSVRQNNLHPAQKPKSFIDEIISISSKQGDIVLDPFLGSGTTAVSCLMLKRKFIGIEQEQEWVDVANKRLKPLFEQRKLGE